MSLTTKEQILLDSIKVGMDNPGSGWLDQLAPSDDYRLWAGVLSALIKKGLVHSHCEDDAYWIELI